MRKFQIKNGKYYNCLIDTGAQCSVLNKNVIPKNTIINKDNTQLTSVLGEKLKTIGKVKNLEAKIDDTNIIMDAIVTEENLNSVIIGADTIMKNKTILEKIIYPRKIKSRFTIASLFKKENFYEKYQNMFTTEIQANTVCNLATHNIETNNQRTIYQANSRVPIHHEKQIDEEIQKLLKLGIIRESKSPWNSRIVPVTKPDGSIRLCIDYRELNSITIRDRYPIPSINDILDRLGKAKVFSKLDATSGYYQIALSNESIEKTAFSYKNGFYEFLRMPFGLCNAPATFQRAMDKILSKHLGKFVLPYLDDIIIFSDNENDHAEHLDIVMASLKAANIFLNKSKCEAFKTQIKILGFIIGDNKIMTDPERTKAIEEYPKPGTIKELRSFLGMTGFCREFIEKYALIVEPMERLLRGETKRSIKTIKWSDEASNSFIKIKRIVKEKTERNIPDLDKEFILITDASNTAIGAILAQENQEGHRKMISTYSKKLDSAQMNYSTTDKELLAIVKSCEHYRHYLIGKKFSLETDHKSLKYMQTCLNPTSRLLRWSLKLQEFSFDIKYIQGEKNAADGFSRMSSINTILKEDQMEISDTETRKRILNEYHILSGHGSANNMKFLVRSKYHWKSLFKDIDLLVESCEICCKSGPERFNTKNRIINSSRPNEIWEIDLIGRIPMSDGSNLFIVTAIDHYTKFLETKVIKDKSAETVLKTIKEIIIDKHGIPKKIITDNGLEFINSKATDFSNKYGIEWLYNSPYHHNTVGAIERANKTFMDKLKKLSKFGTTNWIKEVKNATNAVNISFNRAIGTSPFIVNKGLQPIFSIDKELNIQIGNTRIEDIRKKRDSNWCNYSQKNIEKGLVGIKEEFEINDKVLVYREPTHNKFKENWTPGYIVVEKILPDAYLVSNGNIKIRVNKKHLKKQKF